MAQVLLGLLQLVVTGCLGMLAITLVVQARVHAWCRCRCLRPVASVHAPMWACNADM